MPERSFTTLYLLFTGRHGYIDTLVYPVKVQGEGAAEEIAAALKLASSGDCDVIVVARGGGSNADLEVLIRSLLRAPWQIALSRLFQRSDMKRITA